MVATELLSGIEKIARLLGEKGFNVSVRSIREKNLFNEVTEFELVRAVSKDMGFVLSVRIGKALESRIHVYYAKRSGDLEDLVDELESLGFSVSVDDKGITASTQTSLDDAYRIVTRLVDVLKT
ncbi:hypothetical protein J4526_04580 [Desulfurococcaceae archaeon MEX13E-LK6-19]|nr:hypothetical protein J4526_04580 [Desulfurococcaceae archaeon MEX13E-LK6-19]